MAATRKGKAADSVPAPAGAGLGRVAYDEYRSFVGATSVRGEPLPTWDEQVQSNPNVAAAWCAAAQAVITATIERTD